MNIHEPATLLTDCGLAAVAGGLAARLLRHPAENRARRWLAWALALTAIAALVGGTYHGFAPNVAPHVADAWWWVALCLIDTMSAAMAMSWMHEFLPLRWHPMARIAIAARLVTFAAVALALPVFLVAMIDYGSTMLAWLALALATRSAWRKAMLVGLALSAVAALEQQSRLDLASW